MNLPKLNIKNLKLAAVMFVAAFLLTQDTRISAMLAVGNLVASMLL